MSITVIPPSSGFPVSGQVFTSVKTTGAGTVVVPNWATAYEAIVQGAGGSTLNSAATAAIGGAGAGERIRKINACTPGATLNFNVGAAVALASGQSTTFDTITAVGGGVSGTSASGNGGTGFGSRLSVPGGARSSPGGVGTDAQVEGIDANGGGSGGGSGTNALNQPGGKGGGCENNPGGLGGLGSATPLPGGGGGGASYYGPGAPGGNASNPGNSPAATSYGAGASGPGAGTQAGAKGADGVLFYRFI